ncbi:MAG: 8-amino-7-oxononanoate synthase [Candidatus Omnitrophica bacterium]|nr:8-amino-7-oxononanoate synthase [Candidatus Omnitrophota bacterium]
MPSSTVPRLSLDRLLRECADELAELSTQELRRTLTVVEAVDGPRVMINGASYVCWCSNDYLGLAGEGRLAEAAAQAARQWGVGARASRLLAGSTLLHRQLEADLAAWQGAEAAMVFPSGYQANLGALGALLGADDAVFIDRLSHASLLDAARATRAAFRVFRHNEVEDLRRLLSRPSQARRRLIVTEGVFSMDGDEAPLAELAELAEAHEAILYVDDAHGAFVTGATGRGSLERQRLTCDRLIYMATLGKALGCQGAFVAGSAQLIDYLVNKARTFIYTTALAPPIVAAAREALRLVEQQPQRRQRLDAAARRLHRALTAEGFQTSSCASHILPVRLGFASRALAVSQALMAHGVWAPPIRPPTVPNGEARLRLSVTALHTDAHVDQLIEALSRSV